MKELAYASLLFISPIGLSDDLKTVTTGKGLDGENSNRWLAALGILTAGEGKAIAKAFEKTVEAAKAVGNTAETLREINRISEEIKQAEKALSNTKATNTGLDAAEGVVASRINVRTGDADITGSGLEYAWKKHGGDWGSNKSAFTISKDELKTVLQDPQVVNTLAYKSTTSGNYIRTVDMGRPIGIDAKTGGLPTNFMTIITDSKGNLVNTFPGKTF